MRSMQYGTDFQISSMVSRIAFGLPGRLKIRLDPLKPPTWRERIAVGTNASEMLRICSPKPGMIRSHTAIVASGVTSLSAGPVPPVVTTTLQPTSSIKDLSVVSMMAWSSFTHR